MSSPPPFQVLAVLPSEQAGYVALVSGPHVHLHMLAPPFAPLASTSTLLQADQHGWLVRTAAVSHDGRWIATGCDGKELRVWEVAEGGSAIKLSSVRKILKKIAAISFNSKNEIVFGDKLGDAYTYPLQPHPNSSELLSKRTTFEVTADPSLNPDGTLLLGHTSPLTSLALAPGEGFVVSSDRDEHVRVSRYPEGSIAERFLVGHTKFISSVLLLGEERPTVVSGGGDRELYVWDVKDGSCSLKKPIADAVVPFITVRGLRRRVAAGPAAEGGALAEEAGEETVDLDADSRVASGSAPTTVDGARDEDLGLAVMGLTAIGSRVAFFSLGATAIFTTELPLEASAPVAAVDIGFPVLAFAPLPASAAEAGETLLLVSYDATFTPGSTPSPSTYAAVGLALVRVPHAAGSPASLVPSHALSTSLLSSPHLLVPSPSPAPPPSPSLSRKARAAISGPSPLLANAWALYQALTDLPKQPTETAPVEVGGGQAASERAASKKEVERRKRNGGVVTKQSFFPGKKQRKDGPAPTTTGVEAEAGVDAPAASSAE